MKIVNVLFSSNLGGMEQAFIDYTESLVNQGNELVCIVKTDTKFISELEKVGAKIYKIKNRFGYMDYPLILRIRHILKIEKADIALAHAGRAISITRRAAKGLCPAVSVNHSSNFKRSIGSDAVFVINSEAKHKIISHGQNKDSVFLMPNMIKVPEKIPQKKKEGKVLVVGAIGRFVKAKGFGELIEAIHILKERGVKLKLVVAGDGYEKEGLKWLVRKLELEKDVEFLGWIKDHEKFYKSFDIFCLPSRFEPFGIVLLEAMLHKKPIVTTNAEGPKDIFTNGKSAVIVSKDILEHLPKNLANGIEKVVKNKKLRDELLRNGYERLVHNYSMESVGNLLNKTLNKITKKYKS